MDTNSRRDAQAAPDALSRDDRDERGQTAPLGAVFILMDQPFAEAVVERAVKYRRNASPNAKKALTAALRTGVKVKGFRDASLASPKQLAPAALYEVDNGDDRLAGAVLKVWDESHSTLRGLVAEQLASKDLPVLDANIKRRTFDLCWQRDDWIASRDALLDAHPDLNSDDVALMLCLVSGWLPAPGEDEDELAIESPRFERWLDELERLPNNAVEWKDADAFADYVVHIARHKIDQLVEGQTAALEDVINAVRGKFSEELRYLEIDMSAWLKQAAARLFTVPQAQDLVADLKEQLTAYRPVRPQAAVRDEEKRRSSLRAQYEQNLLNTVARWNDLMSCPEDEPLRATEVAEAREEYQTGQTPPDGAVDQKELDELRAQVDDVRKGYEQLKSENALLEEAKAGIQLEKAQLSEQIGELKGQLAQSQQTEQYWREAYVQEKARTDTDGAEDVAPPSNVAQVIDLIGRSFPDEIVFALNGKSRKNHPFEKPDELYQALAWLATEFHRLRPNPGPSPDFDRLIKEACPGWSYKPNQTATTMGMYAEWYKTTVNGRTFDLANHICKGNSFDPKNTIRIAFAWDDDNKRIVVGFIGLHQRNRQS